MAQWATILNIQPFPQTDTVEEVFASRYFCRTHLLITNGAYVVVTRQLFVCGVGKTFYLVDSRSSLHEHGPTGFCVAPDVKIGVYAHHNGSDCATAFEQQDPGAIEEEEDAEAKLDGISKGSDVINVIVKLLPEGFSSCI